MPEEVEIASKNEGLGDRHCALTKFVTMSGYERGMSIAISTPVQRKPYKTGDPGAVGIDKEDDKGK